MKPEGMLPVLKPAGMTSHDVVDWVRRWSGTRRVGHCGTLDPMAEGLLLVLVGRATRLSEYMLDVPKTYRAELVFGAHTSSHDAWGKLVYEWTVEGIDRERLTAVLASFVGSRLQTPPMTSARHHGGKRLYELARAGKTVAREPREITVYGLRLLRFYATETAEPPRALIEVSCSAGTYIRTLCADIGSELGPGAYMSYLVRTAVGPHSVHDARTLEELADIVPAEREDTLVELGAVTSWMPVVRLDRDNAARARHGRPVTVTVSTAPLGEPAGPGAGFVRLVGPAGEFLAIGEPERHTADGATIAPRKVFAT